MNKGAQPHSNPEFTAATDVEGLTSPDVRTILNHAPMVVCTIDQTGRCISFMGQGALSSPHSSEEMIGQNVFEIYKDAPQVLENLRRVMKGESFRAEVEYKGSWFDVWYSPVNDEKNQSQQGALVVATDITARVKAEREIRRSVSKAEEVAKEIKTRFLAHMSHEIRTPISAILGFTEILSEHSPNANEKQEAVTRIAQSGRSLLRLIDDILDMSKIDSGKIEVHKAFFSPVQLVNDVLSSHAPDAEQKRLKLGMKLSGLVPESVFSDPARIRQILHHLVSNAIKFTRYGSVDVIVSLEENAAGDRDLLVLDVRDTGVGIPDDEKRKIFQTFRQGDEAMNREFGGSGLGLHLSRKLAERMGGSLELVESRVGQGSRFIAKIDAGPTSQQHLQLPLVDVQRDSSLKSLWRENFLSGTRILLAEDAPDNQVLLRRFLESSGAEVDVVENGMQAVTRALANHYDVVLMDMQMPVLDGLNATRRLRKRGYSKPILALTAHALEEERLLSVEAGCDDHLTKPITRKELVHQISRFTPSPIGRAH